MKRKHGVANGVWSDVNLIGHLLYLVIFKPTYWSHRIIILNVVHLVDSSFLVEIMGSTLADILANVDLFYIPMYYLYML